MKIKVNHGLGMIHAIFALATSQNMIFACK